MALARVRAAPGPGHEGDVDDFTDTGLFLWNLVALVVRFVDAVVSAVILFLTTAVFGLPGMLLMIAMDFLEDVFARYLGISAANFIDPSYLHEKVFTAAVRDEMTGHLPGDNAAPGPVGVSDVVKRFLIVLCGIVYESNRNHDEWVVHLIDRLPDEPAPEEPPAEQPLVEGPVPGADEPVVPGAEPHAPPLRLQLAVHVVVASRHFVRRVLHEGCSATIIGHGDLLIVAFKGTSPFNLNEWICDAGISKVGATPELYELGCKPRGQLHEGFYRALFPEERDLGRNHPFSEIVAYCAKYVAERPEQPAVKLWVTGHSLGAALATVFVSVLAIAEGAAPEYAELHDTHQAAVQACTFGEQDGAAHDDADERRLLAWKATVLFLRDHLRGACTFGNPRAMDARLRSQVDDWLKKNGVPFHRVRNANDIVAEIPIGASFLAGVAGLMRRLRPDEGFYSVNVTLDYSHVGTPWRVNHYGRVVRNWESWPFRLGAFVGNAFAAVGAVGRPGEATIATWPPPKGAFFTAVREIAIDMVGVLSPWAKIGANRRERLKKNVYNVARGALQCAVSLFTLGIGTFAYDHFPSEYFKHIQARIAQPRAAAV